ncbi:hypothetical protein NE681_17395, partial [Faecalibacillus intestinalis]|nr:hypothetical protein [Faecalibacillus intestinalis]
MEVESEEKKPQRLIDAEKEANWVPEIDDVAAVYQELLTQPTIADKSWITRQYDSQVRTST